ncbi:MAG: hypothetical protein CMG80_02085 [Marinobacter sp.]|jgi:methyl-accepting chemotaxis protein|nr:hypothetical protein [Marinobacter sp.]|tara:strand:- start:5321 stop:6013 length:693 start_codon:yes stop_codon:yes gene_type:complete
MANHIRKLEMAITEKEVHVVCFQILKEGNMPTFKVIRSKLGDRGSNSTIRKYRDSWLERLEDGFDNPALSDIPADLKIPIQTMWSTALTLAHDITRDENDKLKIEIHTLNLEIENKNTRIGNHESTISDLISKNENLSKSNENLITHIEKLNHELETLTKENAELITVANRSKDETVDLKDEVQDLKESLKSLTSELEKQKSFTQDLMTRTASALKSYEEKENNCSPRTH